MLLPAFFELVLSTARAGCGMGLVLLSVAVGKWAYANPQPTWQAMWRAMPRGLRYITTGMMAVFLVSHVLLTIREYSGSEMAPGPPVVERVAPPFEEALQAAEAAEK